ncbi:glycosyltransferase family 4 protein [Roseateles sp. NT4]|uniref:glycosyltransferase family 4 protein n=1 Tax=Roseateles sp. NT4 TaxID=3453715 RepID=UPI003EE86F82
MTLGAGSDGARRNALFVHQSAEMYGSDKVLLYIVTGLLARGRYWPIVVVPSEGPLVEALRGSGVEVHVAEIAKVARAVFTPRGFLGLIGQMRTAIRDYDKVVAGRRIELVHSNTLAVLGGAAWAWRRKVRHLWHVHEIIISPRLVSKAFPRLVSMASDKVISNSTLTERWLVTEQPSLQPRSVVVFNGLPPQGEVSADAAEAFRRRTGARPGDLLVVLAGRLNRLKGQGLLIDAIARLKARGMLPALHVAIVGDVFAGQEIWRTRLVDQVAEAGLGEHISFVPFVDDIRPVWSAADIAVVPSTEPESFGMVAIEAMAAAVPVIAAGHGGVLDIVEHDSTGLLFTPCDVEALAQALLKLAHDPALRARLGAEGRRHQLSRFSAESQIAGVEQVYDGMLLEAR